MEHVSLNVPHTILLFFLLLLLPFSDIFCPISFSESKSTAVRKHLTKGFLCAVLDLSGILWPLLIPEYSGIKRRGTPLPGLRDPGISHYSGKYPLPFYQPNVRGDCLQLSL